MTKPKIETHLDIGIYTHYSCTIHDYLIDEAHTNNPDIARDDLFRDYLIEIIALLNNHLNTNIEYVSISQCKYKVYAKVNISVEDTIIIQNCLIKNKLIDKVEEELINMTSSRDGYIPFFSYEEIKNDISRLLELKLKVLFEYLEVEESLYVDSL